MILPGIILAFLLVDISRKDGYSGLTSNGENFREMDKTFKEDASERVAEGTEVIPKMDCKCNGESRNDDGKLVNSGPCGECTACGSGPCAECTGCGNCGAVDEAEEVATKGTEVIPKKDGTFNGKHDNKGVTGGCGGDGCSLGNSKCNGQCHNDVGKLVNSGPCGECAGCCGAVDGVEEVTTKGTSVFPKKDGTFNGKHDNKGVTGGCGGGGCSLGY